MNYRIFSFIAVMWLLLVDGLIIRYHLDKEQLFGFRIGMVLLLSAGFVYFIVRKWRDGSSVEYPLWRLIAILFACLFWGALIIVESC